MIFFAGLINLRTGNVCSFIKIILDFSRSVSRTSLLERNMQKRLFDILEVKIMSHGEISFPMARIYSNCRAPFMELKTIACSLKGVFSFAVIEAKLDGCFELFNELDWMVSSLLAITFRLSETGKKLSWLIISESLMGFGASEGRSGGCTRRNDNVLIYDAVRVCPIRALISGYCICSAISGNLFSSHFG